MKLIFATHNSGKVKEMRDILAGLDIEVLSAEEAGVFEDVEEDGDTFEENALKKAKFVAEKTSEWAVADDSGLCIWALDGAPGVYSARWAGEEDLILHTLAKMKDIAMGGRTAYFKSAAALCAPDGQHWFFQGIIKGEIPLEARGVDRPKLPYDVIFIPEGHERTFAQMSDEEKNSLSHRGEAFRKLKEFIRDNLK